MTAGFSLGFAGGGQEGVALGQVEPQSLGGGVA
jgi:hypothetical protein